MGQPKRGGAAAKPRIVFTDQILDNAITMINRGTQLNEVARKLGCSVSGLSRALRERRGVSAREIRHERGYDLCAYTPERAREVEKLLRQGMTVAEAARAMGLGTSTLHHWAKRGLLNKGMRKTYKHLDNAAYRRMHARYMADPELTSEDIARIYSLNRVVLCRNWRKMGLPTDATREKRLASLRRIARVYPPPTLDELAGLWCIYKRGYINLHEAARRVHIGYLTLRKRWVEMGYDVDAVVRANFDAWHAPGEYDRMRARQNAAKEARRLDEGT